MDQGGMQPLLPDRHTEGSTSHSDGRGEAPAAEPQFSFSFRRLSRSGIAKSWNDAGRGLRGSIWQEACMQLELAVPMVMVMELQSLVNIISLAYVGHLGALELASSAVATSICNCTGFVVLIGMASALETLCGQAFGAGQFHLLGVYMQRALVVLFTACIPMAILWFYIEPLLLLIGQKPDISAMAGQYAIWLIPALPANALLQVSTKFLQTQSIVAPMTICSLATLLFSIPANHLLIYTFGIGFRGAAIATTLTFCLNALLLFVYITYSEQCSQTWTGFSRNAFKDLGPFFQLAVPSSFMLCLEYWMFEMIVLMAGLLPNPETNLSALSVCLTSSLLYWMISVGIGAAASTRVANELGAGRPENAKGASGVASGLSLVQGTLISIVMVCIRNLWGAVFTSEVKVQHLVGVMLPIVAMSCLIDSIQAVFSGVIRGSGRQDLGARINLGAFYMFGIPSAVLFGFYFNWQGPGLWLGILIGQFVQTVVLGFVTVRTDWRLEADKALALVETNQILHPSNSVERPPRSSSIDDLVATPLLPA